LRYLTEHGLLVGKPRAEWALIRCPSHKGGGEAHPSLGISLIDGHFKCHTCEAKGGDIVALHQLRTGLGFREAVIDLGARFND
jgi:DNA primase